MTPVTLALALVLILDLDLVVSSRAAPACSARGDVVVWGGTVCGLTASIAAARQNASVLWLVNGTRLGGMTSGGLGGRDGGQAILGKGLAAEVWGPLGAAFEPKVAEARMWQLVEKYNASTGGGIALRTSTGWPVSVGTEVPTEDGPRRLVSVTTMSGITGCGRVFIDCSYEGDLVRLSGTSYAVGRESVSEFNENMAGQGGPPFSGPFEKPDWFAASVSPWVDETNTTLLPTVLEVYNETAGVADDWVMSYCFRICLTTNKSNSVPLPVPEGYQRADMELVAREIRAATRRGFKLTLETMFLVKALPNNKIDLNSGSWNDTGRSGGYFPFSTDLPFAQHDWPLGDPADRTRVYEVHKWWNQALLHYLATDAEVQSLQPGLVHSVSSYGLCADEYLDTNNWTPALYVRESIRLRGAVVMTQHETCTPCHQPRSVGLSDWGVDIHTVKRVAYRGPETGHDWRVVNVGGRDTMRTQYAQCRKQLIQIPYDALIPRADDTSNLLVPVCASFTHVAYSAFRLEPQYAIFGQSAGVAAVLALASEGERASVSVQAVNVTQLQEILVAQGMRIRL